MLKLLRFIASALHSWLNFLRGEPAAKPCNGQVVASHGGDASFDTEVRVPTSEANEVDNVAPADASEVTATFPGKMRKISDGGDCTGQGEEAVVGRTELYPEAKQSAEERGTVGAAKVETPVESLAETVAKDQVHHIARPAGGKEGMAEGDRLGNSSAEGTDSNAKAEIDLPMPPPATTPKTERRRQPKYRPPVGGLAPDQRSSQSQARQQESGNSTARNQPANIHVRVVFQRGGCCAVSLLPRRLSGQPEELVVSNGAGKVELLALQDQWYQDIAPDNLDEFLRKGIVWKDSGTGHQWLLSGREVFVLSHGTTHRGFVSCPRLVLGRNHVVLCTAKQLGPVVSALREAGCGNWTQLGEDNGVPSGWRLLREVVPHKPVSLSSDADILNILRPFPEIEIALEGGIRLAYNTWLLGYPPAIRVYGDAEHIDRVLIDGRDAFLSKQDTYTVPRWDVEGEHEVRCSSTKKSYSLVRSDVNWNYWPAYSFAISSSLNDEHGFEFCGPLVRPLVAGGRLDQRQVVQVPASNPILLGACPGEVFVAKPRLDVWGAQCLGLPPFDPVWALPAQPLCCNKRTNRILLVGTTVAGGRRTNREPSADRLHLERWCQLVLDANRKGLPVEPATPATNGLWREYKQLARSLWRRLR